MRADLWSFDYVLYSELKKAKRFVDLYELSVERFAQKALPRLIKLAPSGVKPTVEIVNIYRNLTWLSIGCPRLELSYVEMVEFSRFAPASLEGVFQEEFALPVWVPDGEDEAILWWHEFDSSQGRRVQWSITKKSGIELWYQCSLSETVRLISSQETPELAVALRILLRARDVASTEATFWLRHRSSPESLRQTFQSLDVEE